MKLKIISLLICTLFLTSIIPGLTTAKNLVNSDMSVANPAVDLSGDRDLIKITDENPACDIDHYFVVYADSAYLYIYNIKTGETDDVYVGGDIVFPKISENRVVYYDFLYMGFKMYDINTSEKTDLIVTNWPGGGSDAFQFFGDYIVYENYDSDMYSTEIFLYHIATGENIQLTDSPGEDYPSNPCIYKNIVAWQLSESNLNDIVMYNIDSTEYTRVTNTSQFESETFPSTYDNNIVYNYLYYDKLNGTILYALKMYNITTGDETTILSGEEPTANSPEIFSNIVVYSVPDGRLCLYNLSTNIEIQIYENSYLMQPWNLNENYVLFTVLGDGVYLYKYNNNPLNNFNITIKPGVGLGVTVIFDNDGSNDALNEPWEITVQGGFLGWINKTVNSTIDIPAGGSKTVKTGMLFGFGAITISAKIADEEQTAIGTQIIILSMVRK